MIDGRTQLVGLLGWPVEHSLSPAMQNAAFDALGMNWRYVALPVAPGRAGEAVRALATLGFRGANVTVPHKAATVGAVDRLGDSARAVGAVNTVCVEADGDSATLVGHNTDCAAFLDALTQAGFDPCDEAAVVVGAGGAARAAAGGLLRAGVRRVTVLSRTPERAERLVGDLGDGRLVGGRLDEETLVDVASSCGLLVQATPVGMGIEAERSIWPDGVPFPGGTFAYDLVYVPRRTTLLRQAAAAGARCLGGLGMLVAQGARSFELWTGREAPVDVMKSACEAVLGRADG